MQYEFDNVIIRCIFKDQIYQKLLEIRINKYCLYLGYAGGRQSDITCLYMFKIAGKISVLRAT